MRLQCVGRNGRACARGRRRPRDPTRPADRRRRDEAEGVAQGQTYFPETMGERVYYEPVNRGLEIQTAEKLKKLRNL